MNKMKKVMGRHVKIKGIECFEAVLDGEKVWLPCDHYAADEAQWRSEGDRLGENIVDRMCKAVELGMGILTTGF